jgi:TatD DNase family protein
MKIADSHNHLHFNECKNNLDGILKRASCAGVEKILLVGIDPEDSNKAKKLSETHTEFYTTVGIHPQMARKYSAEDVCNLSWQVDKKVVAIGETGFDFYRSADSFIEQEEIFKAHIKLSKEHDLPLVIHDRDAHDETVRVLNENDGWSVGGVMHCFSGDQNLASYILSKGFYLSITGVITYKSASLLREVADMTPLDRILIETDAPYLSPVPYRGKMNEPAYLVEVLKILSGIKKIGIEELSEIIVSNFERLFLSKNASQRKKRLL